MNAFPIHQKIKVIVVITDKTLFLPQRYKAALRTQRAQRKRSDNYFSLCTL